MKTSTRLTSAANAQIAAESSRDFITMPSGAAFQIPITDAVAKYKLDSDGSLYELHSPQTQLPRLGSPKS